MLIDLSDLHALDDLSGLDDLQVQVSWMSLNPGSAGITSKRDILDHDTSKAPPKHFFNFFSRSASLLLIPKGTASAPDPRPLLPLPSPKVGFFPLKT